MAAGALLTLVARVSGISTRGQRKSEDIEAMGSPKGGQQEADLLGMWEACGWNP
jgi:hypothetical protein